jgi:ParB-like chromosome segregation protein Spo0J
MSEVTLANVIEEWPLDRLIPYARIQERIPAQVAQIAASINEFGFNNPILVDTGAGVMAGHGRLLAARKLGLTSVPIIVLDHLTETQKRAYVLADNRLALKHEEGLRSPESRETASGSLHRHTGRRIARGYRHRSTNRRHVKREPLYRIGCGYRGKDYMAHCIDGG